MKEILIEKKNPNPNTNTNPKNSSDRTKNKICKTKGAKQNRHLKKNKSNIDNNLDSNSVKNKKDYFKIPFKNIKDEVYFPYKPYEIQVETIEKIMNGVEKNNNTTILFESPTGTGKTQTLLTAFLYLLKKQNTIK